MHPSSATPPPTTASEGGATTFSAVHPDILATHILTRLDGPALASAASAASQLRSLSDQDRLWSDICHSTWPSTTTPSVRHVISTFKNGARSFFAESFPLPLSSDPTTTNNFSLNPDRSSESSELISAVDLHYQNKLIFTKVQETETVTGWFRCSPFRIDLLDPKDVVPTPIQHPECDDTCTALAEAMTLSWILIDPIGRRAMNLSSHNPVSVQRHWLSGEVQVRFASILSGSNQKGSASEHVQCEIMVTCGGSEGGEMQVREVSLQVEDMDGMHLNGKDSFVILERTLEGKRGKGGMRREEEGRRRYGEYLEIKRERRERKLRREGTLDMLCVAFGVSILTAFWVFILCR